MPASRAVLVQLAAIAAVVWSLYTWLPTLGRTQADRDTEDLLQGTWLREYAEQGVNVRRILALAPGGAFRESVRVREASGQVTEFVHEGTWLYDGTNLKRRYTRMNGKAPSRLNVPFATFEIRFDTRNEFLGVDHVHGHRVRYRRVAPDTPA